MKQMVLVSGILIASLALVGGCKKKDAATTEGSAAPAGSAGSAAAMGSGSATAEPAGSAAAGSAAAGSAAAGSAAGSAAAAAPTSTDPAGPAKVTAKRGGKDEGSFDKALYAFRDKSAHVYIAQACDKFNCAHIDAKGYTSDQLDTDCPGAKVMKIGFNFDAEPKAGAVQIMVEVNSSTSGGTITSNWAAGGKVAEVSDKVFKGSIDVKDGKDYAAKGEFTATVCK